MNMQPYDPAQKDCFSKETDYVIHTKGGQTRIAGLFKWRDNYDDEAEYVWVTAEGMRVIENDNITHWGPIQF